MTEPNTPADRPDRHEDSTTPGHPAGTAGTGATGAGSGAGEGSSTGSGTGSGAGATGGGSGPGSGAGEPGGGSGAAEGSGADPAGPGWRPAEPSHPDGPDGDRSVRRDGYACAGPARLDLALEVGRIDVTLTEDADRVHVELRPDGGRGGWSRGLSGLLNRLGDFGGQSGSIRIGGHEISLGGGQFAFGGRGFDLSELLGSMNLADLEAEAVQAAEIDWSEPSRTLTVRSSTRLPLRVVPLALSVRAPAGSRLTLDGGSGPVTVTGRSGHAEVRTGAGDIELDDVDGDLRLTTGSGAATGRSVTGRTQGSTGSGDLVLDALGGPSVLKAGSGDIRLGAVRADVQAKTGSGDLSVADAERGRLDLVTGSGDLRIAVHAGVAAELDLSSGSGRTRSDLEVRGEAPAGGPVAIIIHGRTGSGDVLVGRAGPTGAAG
jgi:hypothetical protein